MRVFVVVHELVPYQAIDYFVFRVILCTSIQVPILLYSFHRIFEWGKKKFIQINCGEIRTFFLPPGLSMATTDELFQAVKSLKEELKTLCDENSKLKRKLRIRHFLSQKSLVTLLEYPMDTLTKDGNEIRKLDLPVKKKCPLFLYKD